VKTFFRAKDSFRSRQDMQALGIREELWLERPHTTKEAFHVPNAPYVLSTSERKKVIEVIQNMKTPSNYYGNIAKCLADGKLRYMKSHNFHVLLQQVSTLYPYLSIQK
jgi:hypothetical protein